VNVDEQFAARGMSNQDIEFPLWRKALGALPGVLLAYGFLTASARGDLARSGFDLWLAYGAIALGVFIFPRTIHFAMTALACITPVAVWICATHHPFRTTASAAALGGGAFLVRQILPVFRPEPFAKPWPTE